MIGDGVNDPDHVVRMGNFHITNATPDESWVTVGECLPSNGWRGNLLLARDSLADPRRRNLSMPGETLTIGESLPGTP